MSKIENGNVCVGDVVVMMTYQSHGRQMPEFFKVMTILNETKEFNYEVCKVTGKKVELQRVNSKIVSNKYDGMWGTVVAVPEDEVRNLSCPEVVSGQDTKIEGVLKESGDIIMFNVPNNSYLCKKWDRTPQYFNIFG